MKVIVIILTMSLLVIGGRQLSKHETLKYLPRELPAEEQIDMRTTDFDTIC